MTQRTGRIALALAWLGTQGCAFDLERGGSAGSGGGNDPSVSGAGAGVDAPAKSTSAGAGGGAGDPCQGGPVPNGSTCAPASAPAACGAPGVVVGPTVAVPGAVLSPSMKAPSVALGGDRLGVLWGSLAVLDASGGVLAGPAATGDAPTGRLASSGQTFALTSMQYVPDTHVEIRRFDRCAAPLDSIAIDAPPQHLVMGVDGAYVIARAGFGYYLDVAWWADGAPAATPPVDLDFPIDCCADARWRMGRHDGQTYVAYLNQGYHYFAPLDACGVPQPSEAVIPTLYPPRFVGSVGDEIVVLTAEEVFRVSSRFNLLGSAAHGSDGSCAFATSGAALLRACRNETTGSIELARIDVATGEPTPEQTIAVASTSDAGLAFDGHAWAVVWMESAGLGYARVCPQP